MIKRIIIIVLLFLMNVILFILMPYYKINIFKKAKLKKITIQEPKKRHSFKTYINAPLKQNYSINTNASIINNSQFITKTSSCKTKKKSKKT